MYLTLSSLKEYLNLAADNTDDDNLLTALIAAAQRQIEAHCNTVFESSAPSVRYFSFGDDTGGWNAPYQDRRTLWFDEWLATDPDSVINGNGVLVAAGEYILLDSNRPPFYALQLKRYANTVWTFDESPENAIRVTGHWAYSTTPPADVVQATKRLTTYLYRSKDSQVFDQTAFTEAGSIHIKTGMPTDVKELLAPYVRLTTR